MSNQKPRMTTQLLELATRVCERLAPQGLLRMDYERARHQVEANTPGNPAAYGYKVYSQCDEDGIIAYIFSLIGARNKTFVEIGCSDGLENNTHALLLRGWRGVWIDADKKKINSIERTIPSNSKLTVRCVKISEGNVCDVIQSSQSGLNTTEIDFFSLDIDGQDLHVTTAFLATFKPRVICMEYNAKFPPPLEISVSRNGDAWGGDDYQGASLCSFVKVLNESGYALVACSLSGVNAFFVNTREAATFPSFAPEQIYQPARYHLRHLRSGHRAS